MKKIALFIFATLVLGNVSALSQTPILVTKTQQVKEMKEPSPDREVETIFKNLMLALQENNYDNFIAPGNAAFKEGLTKEMLDSVSKSLSERMVAGYSTIFLGELKQQGYQVYLWKITFTDGGDNLLARLSLKDGKVGGFWIN
jgi:hypothetical protein